MTAISVGPPAWLPRSLRQPDYQRNAVKSARALNYTVERSTYL